VLISLPLVREVLLHLYGVPDVLARKHAIESGIWVGLEMANVVTNHLLVVGWCCDRPLQVRIATEWLRCILLLCGTAFPLRSTLSSASPESSFGRLLIGSEEVDTLLRHLDAHGAAIALEITARDDIVAQYVQDLLLSHSGEVLHAVADVLHRSLHIVGTGAWLPEARALVTKAGSKWYLRSSLGKGSRGAVVSFRTVVLRRVGRGRHLHRLVVDTAIVDVDCATVGSPLLMCHVLPGGQRIVVELLLSHW
jgi:hypothetical protein